MALQISHDRFLASKKLAGTFVAIMALLVQPLVALNIPAVFATAAPSDVYINEVMPHPSSGSEWIELSYSSTSAQSLKGWYIKDAAGHRTDFENGDTLNNGHRYFTLDTTNLNDDGDTVTLFDNEDNVVDTLTYPDTVGKGESYGRSPDGDTNLVTFGAANVTKGTQNFVGTSVLSVDPVLVAQDFDTWDNSPSFMGFNVGFAVKDFGEVTSATVDVTRADDTHVIKTAGPAMLTYLSGATTQKQASAPFIIVPGTYDETTDTYWNPQTNASWTAATMPTSVKITVVGENGTKSVTNNTFLAGDSAAHPTYESMLPPTTEACNASTFDTFALGTVNGQVGWKATNPNFDEEVVNNTYGYSSFGCKSLRISNAVTSGSFGDQTFSAPASVLAGEGAENNHYEASFDIAPTQLTLQPGLSLSVSPDDGNGNRISYLRFEDQTDGIHVYFDDVTGTSAATVDFREIELGTLSRSAPHTVRFVIDFKNGASNDTVDVYIDGVLRTEGATTWENYYRYDPEQASNGKVVPSVDRLLFRAAGTAVPSNDKKGYLLDNISVATERKSVDTTTPTVPTQLTPVDRAYSKTNDFYFDWTDSHDESPVTYEFQSSQNPHTTGGVLDTGVWNSIASGNAEQKNLSESRIHSTGAPDGAWYWQVRAIDAAGNKSGWTPVWKMTIDTHAPTTTIAAPTSLVDGTFTISGDAQDNLSLNRVYVQLVNRENGQRYGGTTLNLIGTGTNAHWSHDYDAPALHLPDGHYAAHVTVVDMAGNTGSAGWTDNFTVDSTAPEVIISNAELRSENTIEFTGTVHDEHFNYYYCWLTRTTGGEIAGTRGENCVTTWAKDLQRNGNPATTLTTGTDGEEVLGQFDITGLEDGDYIIHVGAKDRAGNLNAQATYSVTVDRSALNSGSEQSGGDNQNTNEESVSSTNSGGQEAIQLFRAPLTLPFGNFAQVGTFGNGGTGAQDQGNSADSDKADDTAVLGAQDKDGTPLTDTAAIDMNGSDGKLFGHTWQWLLVILPALVVVWLVIAAILRRMRGKQA